MTPDRWTLQADMNVDQLVTISDVWLWLGWFFFLPGDALLAAAIALPAFGTFFEITQDDYGGWFSGIVSVVVWLFAGIIYQLISDFLERL